MILTNAHLSTLWQQAETAVASTPAWVPIILVLLMLLIFWWGLTRGTIRAHADAPAHAADHAPTRTAVAAEPDNLERIEGIGPVIAGVLHAAGIHTFTQLAAHSVDDLERIVKTEGGVRIAFPASWPEQARLAAAGAWDALQTLQDELTAGRRGD
jgi:hypothetical protein